MSFKNFWNKYPEGMTLPEQFINLLGYIKELSENFKNKTDLYGDHKGSWQGLNKPTMSEQGMRATVEKHITDITNITEDIKNNPSQMFTKKFGGKVDGTDTTTELENYINYCLTNGLEVVLPSGTIGITRPILIKQNRVSIKGGNRNTIIKALNTMDCMIQLNTEYTDGSFSPQIIGTSISNIFLDGNKLAKKAIYAIWTGQTKLENITISNCTSIGIDYARGCWMFNMDHVVVQYCTDIGINIGANCEGSSMRLVVCEENGINCKIGYTRMIGIRECTFQGFRSNGGGNLLLEGAWDITVDTCWFEAPAYTNMQPSGETYDIYNKATDTSGNIGHNNRFINNSFHGCRTYSTWIAIIDEIGDSIIMGNYFDGTTNDLNVKSYTSGYWYKTTNANAKVVLLSNQVIGGQTYIAPKYALIQNVVGTPDDRQLMLDKVRIVDKMILPARSGEAYSYDGYFINNADQKDINFSTDGKMWRLLKTIKQGTAPTAGTWRTGDIVLNDTPASGGYVGWICITGGTPGTWKGFGSIQT